MQLLVARDGSVPFVHERVVLAVQLEWRRAVGFAEGVIPAKRRRAFEFLQVPLLQGTRRIFHLNVAAKIV